MKVGHASGADVCIHHWALMARHFSAHKTVRFLTSLPTRNRA